MPEPLPGNENLPYIPDPPQNPPQPPGMKGKMFPGGGRAKGKHNVPVQIRATFYILIKMKCYTYKDICARLWLLYGYKLKRHSYLQWKFPDALQRMAGKEKYAHSEVWSEWIVLDVKDKLFQRCQDLSNVKDPRLFEKIVNTLLRSVQIVQGLDAPEVQPGRLANANDTDDAQKAYIDRIKNGTTPQP